MEGTYEYPVTCWFCGKANTHASSTDGKRARPGDGDLSFCIGCGTFGIFNQASPGGLREPNATEKAEMAQDPKLARLHQSWLEAGRKGRH